jgi:hypothetical protein
MKPEGKPRQIGNGDLAPRRQEGESDKVGSFRIQSTLVFMNPITWLRKFAERGFRGYPPAIRAFNEPNDSLARARLAARKARKE